MFISHRGLFHSRYMIIHKNNSITKMDWKKKYTKVSAFKSTHFSGKCLNKCNKYSWILSQVQYLHMDHFLLWKRIFSDLSSCACAQYPPRLPGVQAGVLGLPQHGVPGLPQPGGSVAHRGRSQGDRRGGERLHNRAPKNITGIKYSLSFVQ